MQINLASDIVSNYYTGIYIVECKVSSIHYNFIDLNSSLKAQKQKKDQSTLKKIKLITANTWQKKPQLVTLKRGVWQV